MTDEEFWQHIGMLNGSVTSDTATALTDHLAQHSRAEIEAFGHHLSTTLQRLDTSRFAMLPVADTSDPDGAEPIPLLGDALDNFLCAVVAAGPDAYNQALNDPTSVLSRTWSFEDAHLLLEIMPTAFERATGLLWDGDDPLTEHGSAGLSPAWDSDAWFVPTVFATDGGSPQGYGDAIIEVADALNSSARWREWWRASGYQRLEAEIELGQSTQRGSVRRGTRTARASFHFDVGRLRGRNRGTLATLAADDIEQILSRAATVLDLGPIPELPRPVGAEPISEQSKNRATRIAELKQRLNR